MNSSLDSSQTSASARVVGHVIVKPRRSGPFFARHPWVLDSSIQAVTGAPADGDVVDLCSDRMQWIARGVFNSRSRIRVRLYSWTAGEDLDDAFWRQRLAAAIDLRRQLGYDDPADAARLVFSEGDALSGLLVDRYADRLVVQITALAMDVRRGAILDMLVELTQPRGIVVRTEKNVARAEGIPLRDEVVYGEPPPHDAIIRQHGMTFRIDQRQGQKTGFYLDQRENRRAAAPYLRDRRVLDVCCYSGGFGLAAARLGGAREVLGIDASAKAVELARDNAALNGLENLRFESGDCFDTLEAMDRQGQQFGGVVLDPPRFAGSRRVVEQALRAYHRLNRLALSVLAPGGILVTCSCSGHVVREQFLEMLASVSQATGRDIQMLESRGASPDHPVRVTCPETEYLKCLICRVT